MECRLRSVPATYVGPKQELQGKTALVYIGPTFDDLAGLPTSLTHGWTLFRAGDFRVHDRVL